MVAHRQQKAWRGRYAIPQFIFNTIAWPLAGFKRIRFTHGDGVRRINAVIG
jgi:hypothetical protein